MKMRAILRYRRLHYYWQLRTPDIAPEIEHLRPRLVPVIQYPEDGSFHQDSTPMIYELEARHPGQRSIVPDDPAHAFLAFLIEDMADEWLTKCMFHYRWYYEADATKARRVIPHWVRIDVSDEQIASFQKAIGERQIGRLRVVGSNDVTAPVIEESYLRFLRVFDAHLQGSRFLFGRRGGGHEKEGIISVDPS